MGGNHKGCAFGMAAFAHQLQHLISSVGIQAGGGLIGNHQPGPFDQRPRNRHPLALPARQGIGPVLGVVLQTHRLELCSHPFAPLGGGHSGDKQRGVHVFGHRHHWHQVKALKHKAQRVTT